MAFRKYLTPSIIISVLILGAVIYFFEADAPAGSLPRTQAIIPHIYKNSDINITKSRIKAFYVVPANKIGQIDSGWKEKLATTLSEAAKFHNLQFRGSSLLAYDIFPEPLILKHDNAYYDTDTTSAGNPRGLVNIGEEIEARVFATGGDLYKENFSAIDKSEYRVMALFYEGVGGAGGVIYESELDSPGEIAEKLGLDKSIVYIVKINSVDGFLLVNKRFLDTTIFYHEFAHTLGLPDAYDEEDNPSSSDIMGSGRKKPIENTYLDRDLLKEMGII